LLSAAGLGLGLGFKNRGLGLGLGLGRENRGLVLGLGLGCDGLVTSLTSRPDIGLSGMLAFSGAAAHRRLASSTHFRPLKESKIL